MTPAEQQRQRTEEQRKRTDLFRAVLSTDQGRALLAELDRYCGYRRRAFLMVSDRLTNVRLGRQDVAIWVHEVLAGEDRGKHDGQEDENG